MKEKTAGHKNRVAGFKVVEDECIWMKAGVVNLRLCDNAYDCQNCPFDMGMRKAMGLKAAPEGRQDSPAWVEHLKKQYHGSERPCRHALMGRIDAPKICTMNYECYHCAFDQMMDEYDMDEFSETPGYLNVSGYHVADGYYCHAGHGWARFEHGGRVRVGLDDFSCRLFGTPDAVELPPPGAGIKQNEVAWSISREGHRAAVLSPVTGRVLARNHRVIEHPGIASEDPYKQGWLLIVEPDRPRQNLKGLFFGEENVKWLEQEISALMGLLGPEYQKLAATGAEPVKDIFGNFPEIGWDSLAKTFLRTEKAAV